MDSRKLSGAEVESVPIRSILIGERRFKAESKSVGDHYAKLIRLHDRIMDRFGVAPEMPIYSRERMAELRYDDEEGEED